MKMPTHFVVGISILCEQEGAEWIARVTDMPITVGSPSKQGAIDKAKRLALEAFARGEGPSFSPHEELAAAVAASTIDAMWRFLNSFFEKIAPPKEGE